MIRSRLIHEQPNADHVGSHFDLRYTGAAPSTADLTNIADQVVIEWEAHLESFMTASGLLFEVTSVDLANPGVPQGLSSPSAAGTRTGTPVPNNVNVVISDTIDRRYRGSRPKRFLPFFTEPDLGSTVTWETTSINALNTAWGSFITALAGFASSGCVLGAPVAVSYFSGKHPNPNPNGRLMSLPTPRAVPALFDVFSQSAQPRIGSQRRRLRSA